MRNPARCTTPGCRRLAKRGRCTECRRRIRAQRKDDAYNDPQWRRTSREYLVCHPQCEHPECARPSREVHHLDGLGPRGPRGHDWANLMALCRTHHSSITATETGFGRRD